MVFGLIFAALPPHPSNLEENHKTKPRYEVVAQPSSRPGYKKIQDAIEAARAEGASSIHPAVVVVEPGIYEESLILYDGIEIEGQDGEPLDFDSPERFLVKINGTPTLPQEGAVPVQAHAAVLARR